MADTFAHGRLSNPPHPMSIHFETLHVNQKPRYVSMYYPAQGVFMAIGEVFFGHPFWGIWLSVGVMCAVICWMMQAFVPPLWALLGGLLVTLRFATFSYWDNSYWGGAVAAIGGALVLGSFLRVKKCCRPRDAALLGLGLVILLNSRPYEAIFFCLPVAVAFIRCLIESRRPLHVALRRAAVPLSLVFGVGVAATLYYFWRTTGNPLLPPFIANLRVNQPAPYFPWQAPKATPVYLHSDMRDFYLGWWLDQYNYARAHPLLLELKKLVSLWSLFLGMEFLPLFFACALVLPYGLTYSQLGRWTRLLILVTICTLIGLSLPVYMNLHYAAPLTGVVYLFVIFAMQRVRRSKWHGKRTGLAMVRLTFAMCVLLFLLHLSARILHADELTMMNSPREIPGRAEVLNELARRPGNLLVLVRYGVHRDDDQAVFGWINNRADIDGSRIVWAHDMGPEKNQELLDYFRGREAWLVEPDENPARLMRYTAPQFMSKRTSAGTGGNAPETGFQQAVRSSGH